MGDFARDALADCDFPRIVEKEDLIFHLRSMGAIPKAIQAGEEAWYLYLHLKQLPEHHLKKILADGLLSKEGVFSPLVPLIPAA